MAIWVERKVGIKMLNLVVIDLGSNSVRMKISEIDNYGSFNVIGYQKEYVRLSENMGKEKTLKKEPVERTIKALKKFKSRYSKLENTKIRAVATAAVRQATNQKEFLDLVEKEVGLKLEVIAGTTEAYLDYLGVVNTLPVKNGLIMDTGGASTELVWVNNGKCSERVSLPIGAVLLSQNFNLTDEIKASDLYQAMNLAGRTISSPIRTPVSDHLARYLLSRTASVLLNFWSLLISAAFSAKVLISHFASFLAMRTASVELIFPSTFTSP